MQARYGLPFAAALILGLIAAPHSAVAAGHGSKVTTTCPTTGIIASNGKVKLSANCVIVGNVTLSGTASIEMNGKILAIIGNTTLHNQANIIVNNGQLKIPQTVTQEYDFKLYDIAFLKVVNSTVITTATTTHIDLTINAYNSSAVYFNNAHLNTQQGNWILANFFNSSSLHSVNSDYTPTETYPNDSASIYMDGATVAAVWMPFLGGTTAKINVANKLDGSGNFTFLFGRQTGFNYFVYTKNSSYRLGFKVYPGSNFELVGGGAGSTTDIATHFGYYVTDNTSPVIIDGLPVGLDVSTTVGSDRTLTLTHVNTNPFYWQVYASNTVSDPMGRLVTIRNSKVNEVGALSKGNIKIESNTTTQLGAFGAFGGTGSSIVAEGADIWNISIKATGGATVRLTNTTIHGNGIISSGAGSNITIDGDVTDACNGAPTQLDCNAVGGLPPNIGGVPLCNRANPLHGAAIYTTSGGGTITGTTGPGCTPGVPVVVTYPAISVIGGGEPVVGATLSVGSDTYNPAATSRAYQWQREGSNIGGATASTYVLASADLASLITCVITPSNATGAGAEVRSDLAGPVIGTTARYVSFTDGLDTNDGTTSTPGGPHGPWKTIGQVNSQPNVAGRSLRFKRGDRWDRTGLATSTLSPNGGGSVGNPVVYDAYGTGAQPAIDGSVDGSPSGASSWTNVGTNIWKSVATFRPATTQTITFTGTTGNPLVVNGFGNTPYANGSVIFAGSSLPTGITAGTTYYILTPSSTFTFSATPGGASIKVVGGSLGSGTITAGISGFPFWNANDVGNILWGFAALGGTAPASVTTASVGKMTGGGLSGVWYKPGDGTANLGSTQGNWNFNTDDFTVQIYSVGNPATAMPGLRLVLDSAGVQIAGTGDSNIVVQNFTFQYLGAISAIPIQGSTNVTFRDNNVQWVGGGNTGGGSVVISRGGDGINPQFTWDNILAERNYFYQMYDVCISPQQELPGAHDNVTFRNNICNQFQSVWGSGLKPTGTGSTQDGWFFFNNTAVGNGQSSWSHNQRLNSEFVWGLSKIGEYSSTSITVTNSFVVNNSATGLKDFAVIIHPLPNADMATMGMTWDYNNWQLAAGQPGGIWGSGTGFGNDLGAPLSMTSWSATYGFDSNGLIDVSPAFVSATNDFTPQPTSPLRNTGANLSGSGVVLDFFKNPRPASGPFTIGAIQ